MSLPLGLLMSASTSTPSTQGPATAEQGAVEFAAVMQGTLDVLAIAPPTPDAAAELVFTVDDGPRSDTVPNTVAEVTIWGTEFERGATDPVEPVVVVPLQANPPVPPTPTAVRPTALTVQQPNMPTPAVAMPYMSTFAVPTFAVPTSAVATPATRTATAAAGRPDAKVLLDHVAPSVHSRPSEALPTAPSTTAPVVISAPATLPLAAVLPADPMAPHPVRPTPVHGAPATPAAPVPSVPLATQVVRPLFSLAGVKPGEHVLTISVKPDTLGPVTVRAHVTGEGIRVELFAPTDLAREALRAILPDLRRDLAGSGMNTHLDLSSQDQASDPHAARHERTQPDTRNVADDHSAAPNPERTSRTAVFGTSLTIDVMA